MLSANGRPISWRLGLVLAAAGMLLVAGCGGGDTEPTLERAQPLASGGSGRPSRSEPVITGPLLFPPGTSYAAEPRDIYVPYDASGLLVGEYPTLTLAYWAQTFIASGRQPSSLTVPVFNNLPSDVPPAPFRFRVLLVEAPGPAGQFMPGAVLWESAIASVTEVQSPDFFEVTFRPKGVALKVGGRYAWVIDTYSTRDGASDVGQLMANLGSGVAPFLDGEAYWATASGQGRPSDFAVPWTLWSPGDVAFLLRFAK